MLWLCNHTDSIPNASLKTRQGILSCTSTNVHTAGGCGIVLASIVYPIPHHSSSRDWRCPRNSDTGGTSWLSWKVGRWTGTCNNMQWEWMSGVSRYPLQQCNQTVGQYSFYSTFRLSYIIVCFLNTLKTSMFSSVLAVFVEHSEDITGPTKCPSACWPTIWVCV